ncbi:hypothetical protein EN829_014880 [Mesorhizobium sp. M00.F.Ca.ET.186.01.1.1]|nr:hypothetical protein EN848_14555 [bacterium M00.F.Ca.ET.205.01.1.1]TGU52968.1 hypothetical protein EN795_14840 [bacterium M00.F.Ca.ET.152.01.1.1]TGV35938.1 hypothetical protein EN829_014880 [Mesorhizobium sp. M00.F.Ca.ET.186.01.1.1]TGZ43520.1 hypothetical protein EN805_10450 [bacterium M00.F.Ca.ET.162.01.1.1]
MHQTHSQSETAAPIPASLAGKPGQRFSDARRLHHPEAGSGARNPRAVELADALREIAGCGNGATEMDLSVLGFSVGEIIAHLPEAKLILAETFVREIAPTGDRLQQIIEKAIASAAHIMPKTAGLDEASEDAAGVEWRRYCAARAAFRLDPWWSQSERVLVLLKGFLRRLPLLEREANRVIYAVAAEQKATVHRGEHA